MPLHHRLEVASPAAAVFAALCDLDRALPCVPGLRLVGDANGGARGAVTLRDGERSLAYEVAVSREHADADQRTVGLLAACHPTGPSAGPSCDVRMEATVDGIDAVRSRVDLTITGDGVADDGPSPAVVRRLLQQFSRNLEVVVDPLTAEPAAGSPAPEGALGRVAGSTQLPVDPEAEPQLEADRVTVRSVIAPWPALAAVTVIGLVIVWWLHRRSAFTTPI